jgi:hypothetical protein
MYRNVMCSLCAALIGTGLLSTFASSAHAATENLVVFDEALQNGSDCSVTGGQAGFPVRIGYVSVVHTGTYSIAVQDYQGVEFGWCPSVTYSITSDYDGISFWVNGGANGAENVFLILGADGGGGNPVASATLSELYGSPIPINTWVHIQASFSKLPFVHPSGTPIFNSIYFSVYSDTSSAFFILDDISLTGADIFKNGFES